ncbi:flagellar motor switch protein FliG [Benzoatithermus flavus]|uniref:Flagellar motor switch protein FliG n=1 Tax=Benzoatithermus flavus TaxID=3108223 RepID=A0ABU8XS79_9PROT
MSGTAGDHGLSGAEKAAVVMLALGEERAARLLSLLGQPEVMEISRAVASLGPVEAGVVEAVLNEFAGWLARAGGIVVGGIEATEKLLRHLDAGRADTVIAEIRGPAAQSIWERLASVDEAVLASYLEREHPQAAALILSRIDPTHAARVLKRLPEDPAIDVVMRMLRLDTVRPDIVADVERSLEGAPFLDGSERASQRDRHALVAELFDHLDRTTETRLIRALEERSREAAERVRSFMFTFEDLTRVDGSGIQKLIRSAGNQRLATALKGASEPLRGLFFGNMSERAGKMLREEMQAMGPIRLKDVEEAQQFLVNLAKELVASGEIVLASGSDEPLVE